MDWGNRDRKLWITDERGFETNEDIAASYDASRERCTLTRISTFGFTTSGSMAGLMTRWRRCEGIFFRLILNLNWSAMDFKDALWCKRGRRWKKRAGCWNWRSNPGSSWEWWGGWICGPRECGSNWNLLRENPS